MSVFARLNYNYLNRYYFTVTGRADAASNFAAGKKWGFFPSAAFKWAIKQERFMKRAKWLSDLQFRASVGLSGNDGIGAYNSIDAYASSMGGYLFDGKQEVCIYPTRVGDPDLTWEKTRMYNAAIEAAFAEAKTVKGKPSAIIMQTVKGKDVSFMENNAGWHGKAPNDEQFAQAKAELEAAIAALEG